MVDTAHHKGTIFIYVHMQRHTIEDIYISDRVVCETRVISHILNVLVLIL